MVFVLLHEAKFLIHFLFLILFPHSYKLHKFQAFVRFRLQKNFQKNQQRICSENVVLQKIRLILFFLLFHFFWLALEICLCCMDIEMMTILSLCFWSFCAVGVFWKAKGAIHPHQQVPEAHLTETTLGIHLSWSKMNVNEHRFWGLLPTPFTWHVCKLSD